MIAGCDEERQAKPVHRSHGICPLFGAFAVIDHVACMQERLYVSGAALLLHPRGHRRKGAGITLRIHLRVADPGDGKSGCGSLAPFSVRLGERTASFSRLGEECPDRWGRQWVPCQGRGAARATSFRAKGWPPALQRPGPQLRQRPAEALSGVTAASFFSVSSVSPSPAPACPLPSYAALVINIPHGNLNRHRFLSFYGFYTIILYMNILYMKL